MPPEVTVAMIHQHPEGNVVPLIPLNMEVDSLEGGGPNSQVNVDEIRTAPDVQAIDEQRKGE